MLLLGDCNNHLKEITDNSIDLIVSDPPYGLEFMGKDWDKVVVPTETWKECFRVLKQGKLAFVMCSPRQDVLSRMIVNLQDAGFRTNYTSIYWTFASGFPKAANISKLIDKRGGKPLAVGDENKQLGQYLTQQRNKLGIDRTEITKLFPSKTGGLTGCLWNWEHGENIPTLEQWGILKQKLELDDRFDDLIAREEAEREIIATKLKARSEGANYAMPTMGAKTKYIDINITKPATEEAKKMEGAYVGFQPKPAVEVILVVSKGKTLTWLDDCRIPYQSEDDKQAVSVGFIGNDKFPGNSYEGIDRENRIKCTQEINEKGRFPANLLVSDDVLNDGKITKSLSRIEKPDNISGGIGTGNSLTFPHNDLSPRHPQDEGSYSRYFSLDQWWAKTFPFLIVPKAGKAERNKGCESLPERDMRFFKSHNGTGEPIGTSKTYPDGSPRPENKASNHHPTVKPLKLMSYLITMGSRESDLVLDPFCGSGTVCIAAHQLHRKWLGIEMNPEYAEIIKKRLADPLAQLKLSIFT